MALDRARYTRQIRLPEIGEAGQDRLMASEVKASGRGDAREVEVLYLERAGVRVLDTPNVTANVNAQMTELALRDPAAREVADGALRALVTLRKLLGVA